MDAPGLSCTDCGAVLLPPTPGAWPGAVIAAAVEAHVEARHGGALVPGQRQEEAPASTAT